MSDLRPKEHAYVDRGDNVLWPVTVVRSRYNGDIEGAKWVAFHEEYDHLSPDVFGNDPVCDAFFRRNTELIGRGATPDAAVVDLHVRYGVAVPQEGGEA